MHPESWVEFGLNDTVGHESHVMVEGCRMGVGGHLEGLESQRTYVSCRIDDQLVTDSIAHVYGIDEEILELGHTVLNQEGREADDRVIQIDRDPHPPLPDSILGQHQPLRVL